eukprot:scaffold330207_cov19-Prasinocladus_malaysianus.AAC.1
MGLNVHRLESRRLNSMGHRGQRHLLKVVELHDRMAAAADGALHLQEQLAQGGVHLLVQEAIQPEAGNTPSLRPPEPAGRFIALDNINVRAAGVG